VKISRMRTAASQNNPAPETTVTTITKETSTSKPTSVDFWQYLEGLKPEDWQNHICYIYRTEPRAAFQDSSGQYGSSAVEKIVGILEVNGRQIPFNDREEIEMGMREKWGGRTFRLILKRGSERLAETRITNEYPPRYPASLSSAGAHPTSGGPTVSTVTESSNTADVAKTAINTLAGQDARATDVAIRALTGAAEVVNRFATAERQPSETDNLMKMLMVDMLRKSMEPKDTIGDMTKMMALLNSMRPEPTAAAGTPAPGSPTDRLLSAAIDRFLSPASVAGPVATASAELVRALPNVASYIVEGIREWRVGAEAQRDTAAIMNGAPQRPGAPPPPAQPRALAATPAPPPTQPTGGTMLDIEFIEAKIVEIFNEGAPVEDSADETLNFLDRLAPELITQLKSLGEAGLLNLFQKRAKLQPATNNMPRLVEFIRAFLRIAGGQQETAASTATVLPPPPAERTKA
jgi:hypothetical protein